MKLTLLSLSLASLVPHVLAWGAGGHEIVATIAQIHLHPEVREKLCTILPEKARCHLAPVASWADAVRRYYPETGPMHYVNPKLDHPADHCTYGENGWINEEVNVLTAIMNKTQGLADGEGDITLRFLVHFLGDLHQPLHLTGRDKGGNGALMRWEGRGRSLHSIWDSGLLDKKIRELGNHTTRLPNDDIEAQLPGAIFDPYVRWIEWEGIRQWWREDVDSWIACPAEGDPYPHSDVSAIPKPRAPAAQNRNHLVESAIDLANAAGSRFLPDAVWTLMRPIVPVPAAATENLKGAALANHPARLEGAESTHPACPYTWSKANHQINCDFAWPKDYDGTPMELDTPEYMGPLNTDKIIERLLAQGGLRLAKILNIVLGEGKLAPLYFPY